MVGLLADDGTTLRSMMDLRFLTLPKFDGKTLKPLQNPLATGGAAAHAWQEDASEGPYRPVFRKVREILESQGETVSKLAKLEHGNINRFGNQLYRIDASRNQYFLKILGEKPGNRREIFVWKILGYGKDGMRKGGAWIKGLPAKVFPMAPFNAILTQYYPGQIRTIGGGAYEFPQVMALVLYLDETLRGLHDQGMLFMDLCPDNILYKEADPNRPMLFFLTDMGSVKAITHYRGEGENWRQWQALATPDRVTRAEVEPPPELFPQQQPQKTEDHPGYDDHTLARTALLLCGFGRSHHIQDLDLSTFENQFNMEQPFQARHSEMATFLDLLRAPLRGQPIQREKLHDLFCQFFRDRAAFAAKHIDDAQMRDHWQASLLQKVTRYKMVLNTSEKERLPLEIKCEFENSATAGSASISGDLKQYNAMCDAILEGALETATDLLADLNPCKLRDFSPTAKYALDYHAKVLRALCREHGIRIPQGKLSFTSDLREEIPESETLAALRRGQVDRFGVLVRSIS